MKNRTTGQSYADWLLKMRFMRFFGLRRHQYILQIFCITVAVTMLCACGGQDLPQGTDTADENINSMQESEAFQTEILKSPPELSIIEVDSDTQMPLVLQSGNYSWYYSVGEDEISGGEACGPHPLDEALYKDRTRNVLRIMEHHRQDTLQYETVFSVTPDQLTVDEWDIDCLGNTTNAEAKRITYDEPPYVLKLFPNRIYELTACWKEESLPEKGFYGQAGYAFMTLEDDMSENTETDEDFEAAGTASVQQKNDNTASVGLSGWCASYLKYLNKIDSTIPFACTYSLIYVDEDDIPELVIDTGVEAGGCVILTYHDGTMDELQTMRLNFTYIERENLLCNADGHMGYYYDSVYTIRDGKWVYVGGGEYGDGPDGMQFDDEGELICVYSWDGETVSEEEYGRQLEAVYPSHSAVHPERYYILDDLRGILSTGYVASAGHRYELVVQDLTWKEADKLCREKGGYLATITSGEEFERIKVQIVAEDKTDVTFFVGADNERGEEYLGYHWTEPDGTTYNMLECYNALFTFWMENPVIPG